jgi:hypothetical protein
MGLLKKALKYREEYLKKLTGGSLLNRTLEYLGFRKQSGFDERDSEYLKQLAEKSMLFEKPLKYYDIINNISIEAAKINLNKNACKKFTDLIIKNYNFSKAIMFIFSPRKNKFSYWSGKNIKENSLDKISFDLKFCNIYKKIVKENHYLLTQENEEFFEFGNILSDKDIEESDFELFIPFIFSGRVIGIFVGLKLANNELPDEDMINSLEIVGRFNGALMYNIFHQENIKKS